MYHRCADLERRRTVPESEFNIVGERGGQLALGRCSPVMETRGKECVTQNNLHDVMSSQLATMHQRHHN